MLLRSSSTPVLGSLLSSFSDSPQKHPTPNNVPQNCIKLSSNNGGFQINVAKSSMHSPASAAEISCTQKGFRSVRSEANLEELGNVIDVDDFPFSNQYSSSKKIIAHGPILEAIPSFSSHYSETGVEDYDSDEAEREGWQVEGSSNPFVRQNLVNAGEGRMMYMASGTGIPATGFSNGCSGGGGSYSRPVGFNRDGGDRNIEEHYKRMLEESPGNALFLRNYAHFLRENGDLEGAEEYYSRSILADPEDGEVLCQYAKLIWELHHDTERAASYFERAVQASSQDSHINASYASFLWDTEEDDDEENEAPKCIMGWA